MRDGRTADGALLGRRHQHLGARGARCEVAALDVHMRRRRVKAHGALGVGRLLRRITRLLGLAGIDGAQQRAVHVHDDGAAGDARDPERDGDGE